SDLAAKIGDRHAKFVHRSGVFVAECDVAYQTTVGVDRDSHSRIEIALDRMLPVARHRVRLLVAGGTHLECDAPIADIVQQRRILACAYAVSQTRHIAVEERALDRGRTGSLARVARYPEEVPACIGKCSSMIGGGELSFGAGEIETNDAGSHVPHSSLRGLERTSGIPVTQRTGDETCNGSEIAL